MEIRAPLPGEQACGKKMPPEPCPQSRLVSLIDPPKIAPVKTLLILLTGILLPTSYGRADAPVDHSRMFIVQVIDEKTKRGVPLVELSTTAGQQFVTDSNGIIVITSELLMGKEVFFHVRSHGYSFPKDGFGMAGRKLLLAGGKRATLGIRRTQIAERLYRITGMGIYADSRRAGLDVPIQLPILDPGVVGCDSVQSIIYNGKLHWFWGDTNRIQYPLGNFHTTGAVSALRKDGKPRNPERGVNIDYFKDGRGFVKPVARMEGEGPTWLSGLAVVPDKKGRKRMVGSYVKIRNFLEVYERGLVAWNDEKSEFEHITRLPLDLPAFPQGHSFRHTVRPENGKEKTMVYFGDPYPFLRIPYSFEAWQDPSTYEVFAEASEAGSPIQWRKDGRVHRPWNIEKGRLRRKASSPLVIQLVDAGTGEEVVAHRGTVNWNTHREKWIMITTQAGGKSSYLGEVWYAEAEKPEGPWRNAVKIVTHDHYSFYNPRHHPYFDSDDGRFIYFEGTYTTLFSKTPEQHKTPLYDYNQIMYRLDLDGARLHPARKAGGE
jgi:hypothetical protein